MLTGKRILIVEDEPLIALDLEACVKDRQAHKVDTVDCVPAALDIVSASRLDGIILDLMLKGVSARPLVEAIMTQGVPIVIHSASVETTSTQAWPTIPVVNKPSPPEEVVSMLEAVIRARARA